MTSDAARRELDLTRAATRALRKAVNSEGADRTRLLRQVADLLVDLRALYTDSDGEPDWRGKSYAYRDAVRAIYAGAGLSADTNDSTKTALRYHIGNVLRERLDEDTLKAVGLSALDPRDRQAKRRAELGESAPQSADALIADLAILAKRLDDARSNSVTDRDFDRLDDATERLLKWLEAHRKE